MSEAAPILVAGVGALGARCAHVLHQLGQPVRLLDREQAAPWVHRRELAGLPWHQGDVRDPEFLVQAGLLAAKALVVCTGDEVHNLSVATLAAQLAPGLRLVVALHSDGALKALALALPNAVVLDPAGLTAPNFLYGALYPALNQVVSTPAGPFLLGPWGAAGSPLAPSEAHQGARPWAWLDPDGQSGEPLAQGMAFVPVDAFAREMGLFHPERVGWAALRPWWKRSQLSEVFAAPLALILSALTLLVFSSTAFFAWAFGLGPLRALYFVVTALSTTGFGDITPKDTQHGATLLVVLLMLAGPILVGSVSALLTDFLLAFRLGALFQQRSVPRKGHVIVYGLGRVGSRILAELERLGLPAVGIAKDLNQAMARRAQHRGVTVLAQGEGPIQLDEARWAGARALLIVTDDESHNLRMAMEAEAQRPGARTGVRVNDPEFLRHLQTPWRFERLDGVAHNAAPVFALACLGPASLCDAFALGQSHWAVGAWTVGDGPLRPGEGPADWRQRSVALLAWAPVGGAFQNQWPPGRLAEAGDRLVVAAPVAVWWGLAGPAPA